MSANGVIFWSAPSLSKKLSQAEIARFQEISIPGYARIGAPRVGQDRTANEWILDARKPRTPEEAAAVLKGSEGYYAVRLVKRDGLPEYSHGDLYEGADATSFRGAFLNDCPDVLSAGLLNDAWNHKFRTKQWHMGRPCWCPPTPRRPLVDRPNADVPCFRA